MPRPSLIRRCSSRAIACLGSAVGLLLVTTGTSVAQPPPCINYVRTEESGRVEIDLRQDPATGTFSTLTIFWFINDPVARPGTYNWTHVLNGIPQGNHLEIKDDNLHTVYRVTEGWHFGDIYKFQAAHFSPATNTQYLAVNNECVITPR
jgi:hypothetical protein